MIDHNNHICGLACVQDLKRKYVKIHHHMDACRFLLGVEDNEVLYEAIKKLQAMKQKESRELLRAERERRSLERV